MFLCMGVLLFSAKVASQPAPYEWIWNNTHSFGYDGPWHAIPVSIGSPPQLLNLYPGGVWGTNIPASNILLSDGFKADGFTVAPPGDAGVYNAGLSDPSSGSSSENNSVAAPIYGGAQPHIDGSWNGQAAMNLQGGAVIVTDAVSFASSSFSGYTVPSVSLYPTYSVNYTLPNGKVIPQNVGLLSLGQSQNENWGSVTGRMISVYMAATGFTPSNSWGLHIGSATMNIPGSLVFGGYDQSRVIGDLGTYDAGGGNGDLLCTLLDIGIGVAEGASPFPFQSLGGMLRDGASNTTRSVQVRANPTVPQLYLPGNTCETIASHLPVSIDQELGFYVWKTNDPLYHEIINSPAYLQFTFERVGGQSNLEINVPFSLLNLTLTSPITDSDTPYFPCKAYVPSASAPEFHLGRAFLQAAFIGMNWDIIPTRWWLAQAPGPQAVQPSVTAIVNGTTEISPVADASLWTESWNGIWTPLPTSANSSSTSSASPNRNSNIENGGLSTGAIAGIAVACGIVGLVLLGFVLFWFYRGGRRSPQMTSSPAYTAHSEPVSKPELDSTNRFSLRKDPPNHTSYATDYSLLPRNPVCYEMSGDQP